MKADSLWWAEHLLQELLHLVDVSLHLPVEGDEGRVCPRSQVVQIGWFSEEHTHTHTPISRLGRASVCV